jgi:hypothetical protein
MGFQWGEIYLFHLLCNSENISVILKFCQAKTYIYDLSDYI